MSGKTPQFVDRTNFARQIKINHKAVKESQTGMAGNTCNSDEELVILLR
jgi:hypothetical protein